MITYWSLFHRKAVKRRELIPTVLVWSEKLLRHVPILLMNGANDWRVNPRSALRLSEKFLDLSILHRLVMYEGDDYRLTKHRQESRELAVSWLDRFVKNGEIAPDMAWRGE